MVKSNYVSVFRRKWFAQWEVIKSDFYDNRDPDFFAYSGTQIYIGRQGSGKTISAVRDVLRIKEQFPKSIVVTNLLLDVPWKDDIVSFQSVDELSDVLVNVNNGKFGVIYLIDEIHTYFNALESKNIPPYVFTEISQQRKQRKLIIGTSQLFLRLAKPFREQCDNMISCSTMFGMLTFLSAYDAMTLSTDNDGNIIATKRRSSFYWHTDELRNSYDTFQKVVSSEVQFQEFGNKESTKGRGRRR